jgi:hypothetical protein
MDNAGQVHPAQPLDCQPAWGGPVTRTRQIIILILVIFAVYAIINSPNQSADVVQSAWHRLGDAVGGIRDFFNALLR